MPYDPAPTQRTRQIFRAGFYPISGVENFLDVFQAANVRTQAGRAEVIAAIDELRRIHRYRPGENNRIHETDQVIGAFWGFNDALNRTHQLCEIDDKVNNKASPSTNGGRGTNEQDQSFSGWNDSHLALHHQRQWFDHFLQSESNVHTRASCESLLGLNWA